jgi:tetratricopeptide (TPR) repeat protein
MFGSKGGDERSDLEKKVKATPNDPQLHQKLALVLLKNREVVEGINELARAAELYEKDGFSGKAIAVLRQLLKYDIENVEVQQRLIGLLARQGLTGDAQAEFEKFAGGLASKLNDDQKVEFFTRVGESLPQSPLPQLFIVDILIPQNKLFEAVSALEKCVEAALASGESARYAERLNAVVSAAGDADDHLEACGFLCYRIGDGVQGSALFDHVRSAASASGDADRVALIDRVTAAIADGWDVAASKAMAFAEADLKLSEKPAAAPAAPAPAFAAPPQDWPETAPAADPDAFDDGAQAEEDASMVQDALGRLQAKVDEEIGDSDLETRYNLGIAYKEMGLLGESLKEFRIATRRADLRLGATSLIADVLAEQGDVESAVAELDALIGSGHIDSTGIRDVRYHKAILLEKAGRPHEAADIFLAISAESPGYRDVRARAERLGR